MRHEPTETGDTRIYVSKMGQRIILDWSFMTKKLNDKDRIDRLSDTNGK